MEWIEISGESQSEAEEHALQMLGIEREDVEFEILENTKSGIFKKKRIFRLRARIKPKIADTKRRPARRKTNKGQANKNQRRNNNSDKSRQRMRDSRSSGRNNQREDTRRESSEARRDRPLMEKSLQEEILSTFFEGLLKAWSVKGDFEFTWPKDHVCDITVTGDGLDDLVGENGEILEAIEAIARIPLKKQAMEVRYAQIHLDIDGYRMKRAEALRDFAMKLGKEVKSSGKAKILEPMDNRDRKIVHDTISKLDGVSTLSEGERDDRRVQIFPGDSEEEEQQED